MLSRTSFLIKIKECSDIRYVFQEQYLSLTWCRYAQPATLNFPFSFSHHFVFYIEKCRPLKLRKNRFVDMVFMNLSI